jgi:hypothetical protein
MGSFTVTVVAVALPDALLIAMQYWIVAPGIIFGFVEPLIGSLMMRDDLIALSVAAETV